MKNKTYYYSSYTDDFASTNSINAKSIDSKYRYESSNRLVSDFLYYGLAKPLTHFIMKFGYHCKIRNKKVIRQAKGKGYFLYGNHSNYMPDAFLPNMLRLRRNSIITSPDAVSIKGTESIVRALGAIPLGDTLQAQKNCLKTVKKRIEKKESVTIYPEAHIWPYYTSVRPFPSTSMKYPVMLNAPCYAMSICYQKRKTSKKPKIVCYIDGPYYPDMNLAPKERQEKLADEIYTAIKSRTFLYSNYSIHNYVQKEEA